jgi:hypothetical protein
MSKESWSAPSEQPGDVFSWRAYTVQEGPPRKWPREEKEQKWWDTDYYSWSNRSTRLIGISEPQQSYAVSLL